MAYKLEIYDVKTKGDTFPTMRAKIRTFSTLGGVISYISNNKEFSKCVIRKINKVD